MVAFELSKLRRRLGVILGTWFFCAQIMQVEKLILVRESDVEKRPGDHIYAFYVVHLA